MEAERIRGGRISANQKKELIEFIKHNPQLKTGKFTKEFSAQKGRELWYSFAQSVNALPGATKDWKKWRKTWADMKTTTKCKGSIIKRHRGGTGGGPPIKTELTETDNEILDIVGEIPLHGHKDVSESQAIFKEIEEPPVSVPEIPLIGENETTKENNVNLTNISLGTSAKLNRDNVTPNSDAKGKHRMKRVQRLEETVRATDKLAEQNAKQLQLQESYNNRKLAILQKDVEAKVRIAVALESIANHLMNLNAE